MYGAYVAPALARSPGGQRAFRPLVRAPRTNHVVLTFDDGPDAVSTPRVLDVLEGLGVQSTFFLVGEQVERNPNIARDIVRRGHEVGSHGYLHRSHLSRSPRDTRSDLVRAKASIEDICGVRIGYFRPPFGLFNLTSWRICTQLGWKRVLWSRLTNDWDRGTTSDSITTRATDGLEDGEIVLLHDSRAYAGAGSVDSLIAALPRIVAHIRSLNLAPARLADVTGAM
jgi:peptidoglycan/xylan/chitin deacetylase (PgdA/CDA1 family)